MNKTYPIEKFYIYFSPYSAHAIKIDEKTYPTVEHAYQCSRYTSQKIIEKIRKTSSPIRAWETSSEYKHLQRADFKDKKLEIMKKLLRLKTEQHEDVRKALIESGGLKIIKHIVTYPPGDGFWDDGLNGNGLNHMGKMWMEIREELKTKKS